MIVRFPKEKGLITIRRASERDREQIVALLSEVLPDAQPHNEPNLVLDQKWRVDDLILVAIESDRLLGSITVGYDGHRGWLYSLAVTPGARRQGLGARLVREALAALDRLGCRKVNLQVRTDNREVVRFYRSLGFEVEDRISMGRLIGET